ncbi:kinase [Coprinopsis marcescibilis]|uniref:mitogen-activated protein kinase kinase n=1 Tax=Coprinopsis marcescibilis TaxID=230819 RepID=A0A5C3KT15_COPMA|nr:kinase [Coprinopsis marcescibilis]
MEAKTTILQKPLGPRGPSGPRRPLPSLATSSHLTPISPPVADYPRSITPTPTPSGRPSLKPILKLGIAMENKFESYAGGPNEQAGSYMSPGEEERTIRPNTTEHPLPEGPRRPQPIDRVREALAQISLRDSESDGAIIPKVTAGKIWGDDDLEELSRLGEGAGGAVHKVRDRNTGAVMARKTITTREGPVQQLLRELAIMSSTEHVNIVAFFGAYMSPSSSEVKVLMEYAEGGSLEAVGKRIRERNALVGEKIAGRLAEGVLQGLSYLHSMKTIHRDIKPSNIVLSREGVVKLCDFGVSGELILSNAGTFTGTSFYMAPERISGRKYTIRSDVWSTGITLLELVQNRFPFPPDLSAIELMMHITASDPPQLEDEPGVSRSDEMKDFIKQTLIVDSNLRPTPKDMLAHPWIISMMKHENTMGRWIAQVWGWARPRKSREES